MIIEPEYQATLDYLFTFVDHSLTKLTPETKHDFNLERMRRFLTELGDPHTRYPVVHVTGTKGKGSTSALIANILRCSGMKVGLFTSPHLVDYTERIQIDGHPISHTDLVALVDEFRPLLARMPDLTTFEITTTLAMTHFARQHVDIAVFEVGLGGRLDATNVVDPLVSIITSISYDHQSVLGNTLAEIAVEKAGIIKPGRPVICARQSDEALQVIARTAQKNGCSLTLVGRDVLYKSLSRSLDGQDCQIWQPASPASTPAAYHLPLLGDHQLKNLTAAWAAVHMVESSGFAVAEDAIARGIQTVVWPCRFEIISRQPLIILDSAHNRDSAQKLRLTLDAYLPGRQVTLLFGASEDKDIRGMLEELTPRVRRVITTRAIHPRAAVPTELVDLVRQLGGTARVVVPYEAAFSHALATLQSDEALVVTGSIFLAAAIRGLWIELPSRPGK